MPTKLNSNGLLADDRFPSESYNSIHALAAKHFDRHPHYDLFAGALNAVAYRYHGAQKAGQSLHASLQDNKGNATPDERQRQEYDLFDFFSNGFSVFESSYYAAYAVGAFLAPNVFSLATEKDQQRVGPASTVAAYSKQFGQDAFTHTLSEITERAEFLKWREIRNVLTHRTAPGRKIYVTIGSDFIPPAEWKLANISLDEQMVPSFHNSLDQILQDQFSSFEKFLKRML